MRYTRTSKVLHWVIALLVISMLFLGYFMFDIPDKSMRNQVINIHKLTGLFILALMCIRITWAITHPKPLPLPGTVSVWQQRIEYAVHYLLYAILIMMPLTGWLMSVASGHIPKLYFFTFNLPIAQNKAVGEYWESVHNYLAIGIIVLVSLHVSAAIYHYAIKKDQVLQRML